MKEKEPTIKERLAKIEQVLFNEIRHEMKLHRWVLLILLALAAAKLFLQECLMECPVCGRWMHWIYDTVNGECYWHCPICQCTEDTPYLAPDPTNSWEVNDGNDEVH